jgi:two-component system nitrogen regulation response regulator GlnG
MPSLLVVDDEANILYSLAKSLQSDTLEVLTAQTGHQGIELVKRHWPDAVILDVRLSDLSGLEVFDRIREIDPRLPIIIITAFAATETAIEATKRGAFEYLLKPIDFHQLRDVVQRALELSRFRHVPAVFDDAEVTDASDRIVGRSAAMQEVYKAIGRVARQDVTVLITGESGTGKELVARALYQHSRRASGPFLPVNCAAIPEQLLESELFGHERGAFTGAERHRIGKFEQTHQGTLFLDEIGDMSPATQAKVLRVLQEQRFERLGSNETIATDVRVLAATNKDLESEVAAGRFRRDLLYRLNGFTIHLPPLRERRDDLPLLIEHFIRLFSRSLHRNIHSVTPEAQHYLEEHDWPGNVRELQSVLRYAIIRAASEVLTLDCLPENLRAALPPSATDAATLDIAQHTAKLHGASASDVVSNGATLDVGLLITELLRAGESDIYRRVYLDVDRVVTETVLRHAKGNQVQASELLGISRTTLRAKLRALRMTLEKLLVSEANSAE